MNPTPFRPFTTLGKTGRVETPTPARFGCGVNHRACLPIASNRAFIRAWAARRAKASALTAAKRLAK